MLNHWTIKLASIITQVAIPKLTDAHSIELPIEEQNRLIDLFKATIGHKLLNISIPSAVVGLGIYGFFDNNDEEKVLESWQDIVELITALQKKNHHGQNT